MIAFLNVQVQEKSFSKRFKSRLCKKRPVIRQVAVEGGLPFFVLDVMPRKGALPWKEIEAAVRANHLKLALPEALTPPADASLPLFKPELFPQAVGLRTFFYLLERFRLPAKKRTVGIIDLRGSLVNELLPLLDLAGEIVIITGRNYLYENFCEWAMKERGATVSVSDDIQRVENIKTLFLSGALPFEVGGSGGVFRAKKALLLQEK